VALDEGLLIPLAQPRQVLAIDPAGQPSDGSATGSDGSATGSDGSATGSDGSATGSDGSAVDLICWADSAKISRLLRRGRRGAGKNLTAESVLLVAADHRACTAP
jgi:hypothetical protein